MTLDVTDLSQDQIDYLNRLVVQFKNGSTVEDEIMRLRTLVAGLSYQNAEQFNLLKEHGIIFGEITHHIGDVKLK